MNKFPKPKSPLRSLILYISAAVVSPMVFAYGIYTGRAVVPVRYGAWDVAQQRHQFLFWFVEAFWLLMAIIGAFVSFEEIRLQRQALAITHAKSAPTPISMPTKLKPNPSNYFGSELRSTSPTGRYLVNIYPEEMRMSLWVEQPELLDTSTGQVLFLPRESWSLQSAVWQSDTVVNMQLMKYPDGRVKIETTFDCASFAAIIGGNSVEDFRNLATMEQALDQAYEAASSKAGT